MKYSKPIVITLFLIGNLSLTSCKVVPNTPIELANQFIKEYEQHRSISYDVSYQMKFYSEPTDTTKVNVRVELIRDTTDSTFGGYIWVTDEWGSKYYNTESLFWIDHEEKRITTYPKEKNDKFIRNNLRDIHNVFFLNPERLMNSIEKSPDMFTLSEDYVSNRHTWKLNHQFEKNEDYTDAWQNIWINKDNLAVVKRNISFDSQGENQYQQWDIYNESFNNITRKDLEARLSNLAEEYEIEEYQEKPVHEIDILLNGTLLPNLEGITYSDKTTVKLHDYLDKLTLYDVWYIDCPPCVKAIPHLNDLHDKYAEMGLKVVGVNPFNNNEKDLKRFPNFLNHNKIDYPIVFVDSEESKDLKVQAYPTFYLVDSKGNILHSEIGFNQEKAKVLDKQLDEYLKNN